MNNKIRKMRWRRRGTLAKVEAANRNANASAAANNPREDTATERKQKLRIGRKGGEELLLRQHEVATKKVRST